MSDDANSKFPPDVIDAPRIILRSLRSSDAPALVQLFRANRDRLTDSFPSSVAQLADARRGDEYVAARAAEWAARRGFWYGLWDRRGPALVGQAQLKNLDWAVRRGELAYLLDRGAEGQGLMAEAVTALLQVAFSGLGLRKVFLRSIVGNVRSAALARRMGFVHEGTLRQDVRTLAGAIVDVEYFGLLASDYSHNASGIGSPA